MYRVLNWDRHFEGAKSKSYNNKTSCMLPTKHGLGYKRLIRSKDGPSLFAAWVALIQVLSRHGKPRSGYCTDTGRSDGVPYTCDDLELLTDIPAKYFSQMLNVCKSHHVGWVSFIKDKDTTGDCQGTMVPLNSDLDSNLNSDLNSDLLTSQCDEFLKRFNETTGKKHRKLPSKAVSQFKQRLKDGYSIDDIITATRNAAQSDYHKETKKMYLTPELMTRDTKLEVWLTTTPKFNKQVPTSKNTSAGFVQCGKKVVGGEMKPTNAEGQTVIEYIEHHRKIREEVQS